MADKGNQPTESVPPQARAVGGEKSSPMHAKMSPPWKPGQSGNPAGKPKGTRHRITMAIQELLDGEAETLTRKAIDMAKGGDLVAMRLCLERLHPPIKGRTIKLDLPPINTLGDVLKGHAVIAESMAEGKITPDEAASVAGVLEVKRRTIETIELEQRLTKIEQAIEAKK
jgi:Family of unknown function (DUF5681)